MDLMGRTKDYLMTRIVDCRGHGSSNYGNNDMSRPREGVIKGSHHQSAPAEKASPQTEMAVAREPLQNRPLTRDTTTSGDFTTTGSAQRGGNSLRGDRGKIKDPNALYPLPARLITSTVAPGKRHH